MPDFPFYSDTIMGKIESCSSLAKRLRDLATSLEAHPGNRFEVRYNARAFAYRHVPREEKGTITIDDTKTVKHVEGTPNPPCGNESCAGDCTVCEEQYEAQAQEHDCTCATFPHMTCVTCGDPPEDR